MVKPAATTRFVLVLLGAAMLATAAGCPGGMADSPIDHYTKTPEDDLTEFKGPIAIPAPIDLLLPTKIRVHQFTQLGTLNEDGKINGLDVQLEAFDAFDDPTKAFGNFRFELYTLQPNSTDRRGARLTTWDVPLLEAKLNLAHWQPIDRRYRFKLQGAPMASITGKFFLVVYFSSPYTPRLVGERVIAPRRPQLP